MFRLIDLIVSVVVVLALGIAALGLKRQADNDSVIIGCRDKLGQIVQSLVLYQGLNNGQFPRTRYEPNAPLTAYTQPMAADPFAADGPKPNDVTAAMFLLARTLDLPSEAFICPGAFRNGLAERDPFDRDTAKKRSNFHARVNDNYALANMYPSPAATEAGYSLDHFRSRLPANFVVAGDTSPGGKGVHAATTQQSRMQMRQGNSPNHERDGQNVAFADGSVQFFNSPFVGVNYDNVYTSRAGETSLQPAAAGDTVLVPDWEEGPQRTPFSVQARRWILVASFVGVLGVMAWIVRHGMKKHAE